MLNDCKCIITEIPIMLYKAITRADLSFIPKFSMKTTSGIMVI